MLHGPLWPTPRNALPRHLSLSRVVLYKLALTPVVQELQECTTSPPLGVTVTLPSESNLNTWSILLDGPRDTVYAGGVYNIKLGLPEDYPFKPPQVNFLTRIWHPK